MTFNSTLVAINPDAADDDETERVLSTIKVMKNRLGELHLLSVLKEAVGTTAIAENRDAYADAVGTVLHTAIGVPAVEIDSLAKELKSELIIMGTGGHPLAKLLGSTCTAVLHDTPCDVLVVQGSIESGYERVLIALDTTFMADHILAQAENLGLSEDQCRVICVTPPLSGVTAAESILAKSREISADLIIIGANSQGLLQRTLLSSTTSSVLDKAGCDVYIVNSTVASTARY
ncbi:MAG: nucleotide-binding universal stress UspA family protein [Limisphaerales bacterium]|jgi:nucleotide-binding universal stress UspA family protein